MIYEGSFGTMKPGEPLKHRIRLVPNLPVPPSAGSGSALANGLLLRHSQWRWGFYALFSVPIS